MIDNALKVPESEVRVRRYNAEDGIIGMMDCSGSTLVALEKDWPGILKMIVSSRPDGVKGCKANERSLELGVPLAMFDCLGYEKENDTTGLTYIQAAKLLDDVAHARKYVSADERNKAKMRVDLRVNACVRLMEEIIDTKQINGIAQNIPALGAGFMLLTDPIMNSQIYTLTNHPGDLTQYSFNGYGVKTLGRAGRTIVGDGNVPSVRAILAGHEHLYASIFRTADEMDAGSVLMRGYPLKSHRDFIDAKIDMRDPAAREEVGDAAQDALKYLGDQKIGPAAFDDLFKGNWGRHKSGMLAYRKMSGRNEGWYLVPNGIMIQDHQMNYPGTRFCLNEMQRKNIQDEYRSKLEEIAQNFPKK